MEWMGGEPWAIVAPKQQQRQPTSVRSTRSTWASLLNLGVSVSIVESDAQWFNGVPRVGAARRGAGAAVSSRSERCSSPRTIYKPVPQQKAKSLKGPQWAMEWATAATAAATAGRKAGLRRDAPRSQRGGGPGHCQAAARQWQGGGRQQRAAGACGGGRQDAGAARAGAGAARAPRGRARGERSRGRGTERQGRRAGGRGVNDQGVEEQRDKHSPRFAER
jgi:hypothetical protein